MFVSEFECPVGYGGANRIEAIFSYQTPVEVCTVLKKKKKIPVALYTCRSLHCFKKKNSKKYQLLYTPVKVCTVSKNKQTKKKKKKKKQLKKKYQLLLNKQKKFKT